ncbi:LysE/ArgO family amino acid transporter [Kurthia huakuii]|uniref:LysE/ArgO family amino acid transporter n=1 Tax=Kurthia huakuii TaxID=1421019 RepID=UPI0004959061|nr:LysE family transporter [Kurthia huakuii]MBM7698208.1 L-lysine exporter family protein LysE/ArgO [Kurthia huakuii]
MSIFFHGFFLALGLILPLGVQNIFIFNQGALQRTWFQALPSAITAACCDTLLIISAVYGVSFLVNDYEILKTSIMGIGIIFLVYMGSTIWRASTVTKDGGKPYSFKKQLIFTMSVSLLNPHALLDTVGVIGTSSLMYSGFEKFLFAISCVVVSWCWFVMLAIGGSLLKHLSVAQSLMVLINKFSAIFIWCTAIYLVLKLLSDVF